jgi:hypothetical protein
MNLGPFLPITKLNDDFPRTLLWVHWTYLKVTEA